MALPTPLVIDANARHDADAFRALCELASEGQEGVRGPTHLAVKALLTPGGAVAADPGVYSVKNTAAGAAFENYVGVVKVAEQVAVTPTDSSGPRTDLVILRVENPYVGGTGTWADPPSATTGPYAHIRVIEGVPPNTQSVKGFNSTWTAITLARITRPASTGIVTQAHITDLRSLIDLKSERIVIITNPPAIPPPIAYDSYFDVKTHSGASQSIGPATTSWVAFPAQANWDIPIPSWACGADVFVNLVNARLQTKGAIGEYRVNIGDGAITTVPTTFDLAHTATIPGWERHPIVAAGSVQIPSSMRGRVHEFRPEMRITANDGGTLNWTPGTTCVIQVAFKRFPSLD